MLKTIIWKEILDHLLSLRFALALMLCVGLAFSGFLTRSLEFGRQYREYREESALDRQRMEDRREAYELWWVAVAHREPNPLGIFVEGTSSQLRGSARLNKEAVPTYYTPDVSNRFRLLFPATDLVFFVGIIMSLLAILFGFDAVSGEKEQGTLRLMLSCGVARDQILLGKWLGGFAVLILPFVICVVGVATLVLAQTSYSLSSAHWLRLLCVLVLSLIYIACIYSMALWISTVTHRSATSLMILVALWLIFVLAIPNITPHIGRFLRPAGDLEAIEKNAAVAIRQTWVEDCEKPTKKWEKDHNVNDPWWVGIDWNNWEDVKVRNIEHHHVADLYRRTAFRKTMAIRQVADQELSNRMNRQSRFIAGISCVSPFSIFSFCSAELGGSGLSAGQDFRKQVNQYTLRLSDYLDQEYDRGFDLMMNGKPNEQFPPWPTVRKPIPHFQFFPPATMESVKAIIWQAGLLALMTIVFAMLGYVSFSRYDVR